MVIHLAGKTIPLPNIRLRQGKSPQRLTETGSTSSRTWLPTSRKLCAGNCSAAFAPQDLVMRIFWRRQQIPMTNFLGITSWDRNMAKIEMLPLYSLATFSSLLGVLMVFCLADGRWLWAIGFGSAAAINLYMTCFYYGKLRNEFMMSKDHFHGKRRKEVYKAVHR